MKRKTTAQAHYEQGFAMGQRQAATRILLRQLRLRFGNLPAEIEQTVQATWNLEALDRWLDQFVLAESLAGVDIRGDWTLQHNANSAAGRRALGLAG